MVFPIADPDYLQDLRQRYVFPLHLHWDGSIPAKDLFGMAEREGVDLLLPDRDVGGNEMVYPDEDSRRIRSPEQLEQVMHGLRKYDLVQVFSYATGRMQDEAGLVNSAVAHCRYLRSQNVPYAEVRFAPQYHTFGGLSLDGVIDASVRGFEIGSLYGADIVQVGLIICIGREADGITGMRVAEAAVRARERYGNVVLGLDLACDEAGNPPEKHLGAFAMVSDTGLRKTVHAGEMCDERTNLRNIATAIDVLGADAVSHAIPLCKDEGLVRAFVGGGIRLESNPLSNAFFFGVDIGDLHLDRLLDAGVKVTVNPDDPAMIPGGDLVHNLYHLGKMYGDGFVDEVIRNSVECAWGLSPEAKDDYLMHVL